MISISLDAAAILLRLVAVVMSVRAKESGNSETQLYSRDQNETETSALCAKCAVNV